MINLLSTVLLSLLVLLQIFIHGHVTTTLERYSTDFDSSYDPSFWTRTLTKKLNRPKPPLKAIKKLNRNQDDEVECGILDNVSNRIRLGDVANDGAFPWYVVLKSSQKYLHHIHHGTCGGTIIDKYFVLTAAHCVTNDNDDLVIDTIIVGKYDLRGHDRYEKEYRIETILLHPSFVKNANNEYDVALLKLYEPISFNGHVRQVCLPESDKVIEPGNRLLIVGLGMKDALIMEPDTKTHYEPSFILRTASMPVVDQQECLKAWKEFEVAFDTRSQMCAGKHNEKGTLARASCKGDFGGPALYLEKNRWTIYGVTSFGHKLCRKAYDIYIRVPVVLDWIKEHMQYNKRKQRPRDTVKKIRAPRIISS